MSNEKSVQEIVAELDKIALLCDQIVEIGEKCDNIASVEAPKEMRKATQNSAERVEVYQESQKKTLTDVASRLPIKFPYSPPRKNLKYEHLSKFKIICSAISLLLIYVSLLGIVLGCLIDSNILALCLFPLIGITIFMNLKFPVFEAVYYLDVYTGLKAYEERLAVWEKDFDEYYTAELNESKYIAFRAYDAKFLSYVEACDKNVTEEKARHNEELERITERFQKKLEELYDQKGILLNELTSTTLIPEELYCYAYRISSMLKQKRADSLKEAINLALDERRKEEEEEARREEAARREAILERQAYDNRMHNEAMQRAAEEEARATREHNAAMERAAREHNAAMERAAQAQADSQRAANAARCLSCAKSGTCSYEQKQATICQAYVKKY